MTLKMREILESKRVMRQRLAVLPITGKLRLLDELRLRSLVIGEARLGRKMEDIPLVNPRKRI